MLLFVAITYSAGLLFDKSLAETDDHFVHKRPMFAVVQKRMTLAEALAQDLIHGNPEICIGGLDMPSKLILQTDSPFFAFLAHFKNCMHSIAII
jgi:hypothetical protein